MKRLEINLLYTALSMAIIAMGAPLAEAATLSGFAVDHHITGAWSGPGKASKGDEQLEIGVGGSFNQNEFEARVILGLDTAGHASHFPAPKPALRGEMAILVDILAAPGEPWMLELDLLRMGTGLLRTEYEVSQLGLGDPSATVLSANFGNGDLYFITYDHWTGENGEDGFIRYSSASISGTGSATVQILAELGINVFGGANWGCHHKEEDNTTKLITALKHKPFHSKIKDAPARQKEFEVLVISGQLQPIPEPSTALLLGMGILALCTWRKR